MLKLNSDEKTLINILRYIASGEVDPIQVQDARSILDQFYPEVLKAPSDLQLIDLYNNHSDLIKKLYRPDNLIESMSHIEGKQNPNRPKTKEEIEEYKKNLKITTDKFDYVQHDFSTKQ